jgi:hypothetical protein
MCDEVGTVFLAPDRVFRGVRPEAVEATRSLLRSGLPDDLAARGLMPATRVSSVEIPRHPLVLEHPRLPVVSYPYEWSYGMLRDAAALVLEISELAGARGYELKDCHAYNVVFDGARPCYVDFGSLAARPPGTAGWPPREEFMRSYVYPLRIWADGSEFMARRLVAASDYMRHGDYGLYRWPFLRWAGAAQYQRIVGLWHRYHLLSRYSDEDLRRRLRPSFARLACAIKRRHWLPGQGIALGRLRREVLGRRRRGQAGFWTDYQGGDAAFVETPRYRRVAELVEQSGAVSVIELAGNQGRFGEELLRRGRVRQVLCTDADEQAVDRGYERARASRSALNTAVLDFICPMTSPFGESPALRLRAEAAIALAVSHHVLLTQKVPVERMLRHLGAFATKSVFVEFMPLGLWNGQVAPPVPDWYRLDWFREAFAREFTLWHEEPLEQNRHLFCGHVRNVRSEE